MEEEGLDYKEIEERNKHSQRLERWERIKDSKFNKCYKEIRKEGISIYVRKG